MPLTLKTTAFEPSGTIPKKFTCDGTDVSPALSWTGAPGGTQSFALIMDDPDAPRGTWVHWVLYDLPPGTTGLPEGIAPVEELPTGGRQGRNDFKKVGYGGPCPPPGAPHRYYFRLFALDGKVQLHGGATRADLDRAMKGHTLEQTELMARYSR